jgi:hypothetical protein
MQCVNNKVIKQAFKQVIANGTNQNVLLSQFRSFIENVRATRYNDTLHLPHAPNMRDRFQNCVAFTARREDGVPLKLCSRKPCSNSYLCWQHRVRPTFGKPYGGNKKCNALPPAVNVDADA